MNYTTDEQPANDGPSIELVGFAPRRSYALRVGEREHVGRADFVAVDGDPTSRIFFHTEVQPDFGGQGLAGMLVRTALADAIRDSVTVIPVCPVFAAHLRRHGAEFEAEGGTFRAPTPADIALLQRTLRSA